MSTPLIYSQKIDIIYDVVANRKTHKEAAEILGYSYTTVRRLAIRVANGEVISSFPIAKPRDGKKAGMPNEFKQWLIVNGTSNKEFAERIGVTESAVSSWAYGHSRPNSSNVEKMSHAMHIPVRDVFGMFTNDRKEAYETIHAERAEAVTKDVEPDTKENSIKDSVRVIDSGVHFLVLKVNDFMITVTR